jgi:2-dehydro-3-deoxyphosphogluconate aldolase / (4S)-4-hydroxy-2-oxoglutarate aldolase
MSMIEEIRKRRIVAVVTIDRAEDAVPLAEALMAGGVTAIELTFRTPAAEEALRRMSEVPGILPGAGTIIEPALVHRARAAGAAFAVSPGFNPAVLKTAQDIGLPFFPGVMTPTDVEQAMSAGCKLLKFFPADLAGGVKMLKTLAAPYGHTGVQFIPLGGIGPANAREYLNLPVVAAIGGSWIADRRLLAARDFDGIRKLAAEATAL